MTAYGDHWSDNSSADDDDCTWVAADRETVITGDFTMDSGSSTVHSRSLVSSLTSGDVFWVVGPSSEEETSEVHAEAGGWDSIDTGHHTVSGLPKVVATSEGTYICPL